MRRTPILRTILARRDILPRIFSKYRVYAYNFIDENKVGPQYWRDVGTIEAYYEANMDLVSVSPVFKSLPQDSIIAAAVPGSISILRLRPYLAIPNRMGVAVDSIVAGGSICSGRTRESIRRGLRCARQQL